MGLVRTNVMLDSELWNECKRLGAKDDRSASYFLNQVLRAAINKKKPKAKTEVASVNAIGYIPAKGGDYPVTQELFDKFVTLYPNLAVGDHFTEMVAWCEANPNKRKTYAGMERFINAWLSRAAKIDRKPAIDMSDKSWASKGIDIL